MSKYYFIQEDDDGNRITHEFVTDFHTDVADRFNEFLLGCGFVMGESRYELVEPETTDIDVAESAWPFEEDLDITFPEDCEVMTWTSEELAKSAPLYIIREPGEFQNWQDFPGNSVCPKCKLSKEVMRGAKCFDANCGMV